MKSEPIDMSDDGFTITEGFEIAQDQDNGLRRWFAVLAIKRSGFEEMLRCDDAHIKQPEFVDIKHNIRKTLCRRKASSGWPIDCKGE
uniref:WYL domain-containing protein n=1 Tax=Panagrellus redivivus TaxID=6233 RepID=A0A7E4WE71_PANRE